MLVCGVVSRVMDEFWMSLAWAIPQHLIPIHGDQQLCTDLCLETSDIIRAATLFVGAPDDLFQIC